MTWRQFSGTPANNASGSTGVNFSEGQAPSTVNDSARQMMADLFLGLASISANVASATTTDLTTATGHYVPITGSVTITGLGTEIAGIGYCLYFVAAPLLTYNAASLILPGAANIQAAAGDAAYFVSLGSGNWRCTSYVKASGAPVLVASQADMETGTSLAAVVTPGRQQFHPCAAKAWVIADPSNTIQASYNVASVLKSGTGAFTITWTVAFSGNYCPVVSVLHASATLAARVISISTGSMSIIVYSVDAAGSIVATDPSNYMVVAYGDQ